MAISYARTLRELLSLAWPVMVSQIAVMASAAIDTAMAGHIDAINLAAVGVGASIYATIVVTVSAILLCLPPTVAHLAGARRYAEIGEQVRQSAWMALGLSIIVMLMLRNPEPLLLIAKLQPAVETKVRAYLIAASWSMPATFLFRVFSGFSTGIGKPRPVMLFNLCLLFTKVPVNLVFMYGYFGFAAQGGVGCATATSVIAWAIAPCAWLWCAREKLYRDYAVFTQFSRPSWHHISALLRLGVPIGATFLVDVTAFTFMALFIARLGPVASAAHQIAANLAALIFMLPLALGNASAVLVGRALGSGDPRTARQVGLTSISTAMVLGGVLSLTLGLGATTIATLYTADHAVRVVAQSLIAYVALYHLADAMQGSAVNILRGYKETALPMVIYAVALWGFGLGGGYVLGLTDWLGPARGAAGFWLAGVVSLGSVGLLIAAYFLRVSRLAIEKHLATGSVT